MKRDVLLVPFGATGGALRDAAIAAEAEGWDGVFTWDHLQGGGAAGPAPVAECWTVLSALASATRRVTLGPLVLNVANRHPGVLANMAATLQDLSGGRLVLGLGAGGSRATPYAGEQLALGQPVGSDTERRQRVVEAIEVIRRLWSGDASDFAGRYYTLARPSGFLRPSPPPPIVVGGFGPRMAEVAGRCADGWNTAAAHPRLPELIAAARRAHAESGRTTPFLVTAFGGAPSTEASMKRLAGLGVDRLIVLVEPPFALPRLR